MENFNLKKYLAEGKLLKEEQISLFPDFEGFSEQEEIDFYNLSYEERKKLLISLGMSEESLNSPEYQKAINNGDLKSIVDMVSQESDQILSSKKSEYLDLIKNTSEEVKQNPEIQSILLSINKSKSQKDKDKYKRLLSTKIKSIIPLNLTKYYTDIISVLRTGELARGPYVKRDQFGRYTQY
jgi:hypothetical protein